MPTTYRRRKPTTTRYKKKTTYPRKSVATRRKAATVPRKRTYRRKTYAKSAASKNTRFDKAVELAVNKHILREDTCINDNAFQMQQSSTDPSGNLITRNTLPLGQVTDLNYILTQQPGYVKGTSHLKYTMNSMTQNIQIVNQSLGTADITLYWCVPRRDLAPNPGSLDVAVTPNNYLQDLPAGISGTDIGLTPYQSPVFCANFKIIKTKHLGLTGGKLYKCQLNVKRPHVINQDVICYGTSGGTADVNYTYMRYNPFLLILLRGQPTDDAATQTNIGLTLPKLDVVTRSIYKYTYTLPNVVVNNTIAETGFGTVTNPKIITTFGQSAVNDASV